MGPGASAGVVVVAVAVSIRVAGAMGGVGAVVSVVVSSGAGVVAGTGAGAVASTGSGAGVRLYCHIDTSPNSRESTEVIHSLL